MIRDLLSGFIGLCVIFGAGYFTGKHYEAKEQQVEIDRLNTDARAKEQGLTIAVNTTAEALRKNENEKKLAIKERNIAIDSGALQLRLPVKASCPIHTATDSTTPTGNNSGETSTESERTFIKAALELTDEGNRAIEKLNACITLYNKAIELQKGMK